MLTPEEDEHDKNVAFFDANYAAATDARWIVIDRQTVVGIFDSLQGLQCSDEFLGASPSCIYAQEGCTYAAQQACDLPTPHQQKQSCIVV